MPPTIDPSLSTQPEELVVSPHHEKKRVTAVLPKVQRQKSLWYITMMDQVFRQYVKEKRSKDPILKNVEDTLEEEDKTAAEKESRLSVPFSSTFTWKLVSWISRSRASLKLRRFRLIQDKLRQDLEEKRLVDEKERSDREEIRRNNPPYALISSRSDLSSRDDSRRSEIIAHLGKSVLNEVNPKLYSVENLYERESLSNNHHIIFYILNWWDTMTKIPEKKKVVEVPPRNKSPAKKPKQKDGKKNANKKKQQKEKPPKPPKRIAIIGTEIEEILNDFGEVSEKHYKQMLICLYRILVPDGNQTHMMKCVEKDWLEDSNGRPTVNVESFVRSIFTLADLWTNSCDREEYIEFVTCLHRLVCRECDNMDWDFIEEFEYYEFDEEDDDLQLYLKLLELRKEEAQLAQQEEKDSTIKKRKIRSHKKITMKDIETQLSKLPSLREYFKQMLKVKKGALKHEYDETKKLKAIFKSFDSNGDGTITAKELQSAIRLIRGHHLHIKVVQRIIAEGDADSDGKISWDEFLDLMGATDSTDGEQPSEEEQQQEVIREEEPKAVVAPSDAATFDSKAVPTTEYRMFIDRQ